MEEISLLTFLNLDSSDELKSPSYNDILSEDGILFYTALKVNAVEGNLVYEYNPFRNYRTSLVMYLYAERLYFPYELFQELKLENTKEYEKYKEEKEEKGEEGEVTNDDETLRFFENLVGYEWPSGWIPSSETPPILIESNELTDFETSELSFDLSHPIEMTPLYSYDNSVNLIINDGKNPPRLINSRWSATERNKYRIVDRKGDNDTNIYDLGVLFDIDTSLYKRVVDIPVLELVTIQPGGLMKIGNYHFYFKYCDADDNETDFVAESGLVSLFIGNTPDSVNTGFRDLNSCKMVLFSLSNISAGYPYVNVYYSRNTADINSSAPANADAYKIELKYIVNNNLVCNISITGYEPVRLITTQELNLLYFIASTVLAQAQCLNRLFFGNVHKEDVPYEDLADCALRFLPYIDASDYELEMDQNYNITSTCKGYYDPNYIYKKVGYWNHELYRFGVVFIMSDSSLSPVFCTRGLANIKYLSGVEGLYTDIKFTDDNGERNYINVEEKNYSIIKENGTDLGSGVLENSMGVVSLDAEITNKQLVYGINFKIQSDVIEYLQSTYNIKGFFIVRQRRIPTILAQAFTIGIDILSHTPILPVEPSSSSYTCGYVAERFLTDEKKLVHDIEDRLYEFKTPSIIKLYGAICPEYDTDLPYLNQLFTGDIFTVTQSDLLPANPYLNRDERHFYIDPNTLQPSTNTNAYDTKVLGVEDSVKMVAIGDNLYSAEAGLAEEGYKFEYLEQEDKTTDSTNVVRGVFGCYLGLSGYNYPGTLIDIKLLGLNGITTELLFSIRYADKDPFYAISERIDINKSITWFTDVDTLSNSTDEDKNKISYITLLNPVYRGDCYICLFTHRLNRNFQDPSSPINDKILDEDCWDDNYEVEEHVIKSEEFEKINLGDLNAIKMGMWVTIPIRSTKNLNVRSLDNSHIDEYIMFGHDRGFYPYHGMNAEGAFKIPDAMCYNKGFERSVSERMNMEMPDVPYLKNEYSNRIIYSNIFVLNAFDNGYRVFESQNFRDYSKEYGSITTLIEFSNSMLCIFEHAIAVVPVNERTASSADGTVSINTDNVLPFNLSSYIVSNTIGSQWKESVIKTDRGIYGVDTIAKKIWMCNGQLVAIISEDKVLEFLNNHIFLAERELTPVIGIRNVKTHYNRFTGDVMFTFYNSSYGFEEKVWNLCFNEVLQKWQTFYSWVPSYSENIYNSMFSFNRLTSKLIAKLGTSHANNDFSDGVCLEENIITVTETQTPYNVDGYEGEVYWMSKLSLENRNLTSNDKVTTTVTYEIEHDNFGNYKNFTILEKDGEQYLALIVNPISLCSEIYVRGTTDNPTKVNDLSDASQFEDWENNCVLNSNYAIYKNDRGIRQNLESPYNKNNIVTLLNVRALIHTATESGDAADKSIALGYTEGVNNLYYTDGTYYESVIAVTTDYNKLFLTTDFWKHGLAGIIDIADTIRPTYWYGELHPFEVEFIVAADPTSHKIFDNLLIISNNVAPESFHYEIIGDCYAFAEDKKNMYIRQEATKELYQYNGMDVVYDHDYTGLDEKLRALPHTANHGLYDKSTLLPLYYSRQEPSNEIEDYYHIKDGANTRDFSALSGGEIVYYDKRNEYRIWNHAKAVSTEEKGQLRGNMQYREDKWKVQINPINIVLKNETEWVGGMVPVEIHQSPIPDEILANKEEIDIPDDFNKTINGTQYLREIVAWDNIDSKRSEVKVKDKWIKIRIRYTGDLLALISAICTLYSNIAS